MTELTEREARQFAGAMRPNRKPLWIAFGANATLAVLLLGVPYFRGRMLAQTERADFVAFARCMIGGETAPNPGLSLPRGEREHYAAKVLYANSDWPLSCRSTLKRLSPPDATFLWPSVKTAGADLRAAVELVDRELVTLAKRRAQAPGRVPQRPLDALKRLQAASVLFARAGDVSTHADNDAVVLEPEVRGLPTPARLPLMLGESQSLSAWSDAGRLQVLGLDSRSLAYLRVEDGKVDRQRARKNAFVRGAVRAGDTAYVVSAMPEARCAEREDGCVGRPTGLSRLDKGSAELGEPRWRLEGHPAERLDRSLSVSEMGRVDLLARTSKDGAISLLRARLPVEAPDGVAERKPVWLEPEIIPIVPPLPAAQPGAGKAPAPSAQPAQAAAATAPGTQPSAAGQGSASAVVSAQASPAAPVRQTTALILPGEPLAVLRAVDGAEQVEAALLLMGQSVQTLALPAAAGSGAWTAACGSGPVRWLAYGSASELHVARADGSAVVPLTAADARLAAPIDVADANRDRLRVVCTDELARVLYVDDAKVLRQLTCNARGCGEPLELAPQVQQLSAVQRQDVTVLSYYEGPLAPTIKLLRLDGAGRPFGPAVVVGSCWEPLGGLCGASLLIGDEQRVALLTRDGPDLLALESVNTGRSWSVLSGFQQRPAISTGNDPMQQHRLRKGLSE